MKSPSPQRHPKRKDQHASKFYLEQMKGTETFVDELWSVGLCQVIWKRRVKKEQTDWGKRENDSGRLFQTTKSPTSLLHTTGNNFK
jgi:hypothetical protein